MSQGWLRLLDPEILDLKQAASSSFQGRLQLARAFNGRCRREEASELLEQLLSEDRANGDLWFERIIAEGEYANPAELETIQRDLEALRDENPEEASHQRNLGYLCLLQNRFEEAGQCLKAALALHGQDPKIHELLGLLALQQDRASEAKAHLLKALSLAPKDPRTLRLLGIACQQLEDFKAAEAQFAAALDVDPRYFWGWHSLGEMLLRHGDVRNGLRCINRARSLNALEPASYLLLSELFSEQGHLEMAQAELHLLQLVSPPASVLADGYTMLGEIRRDLGDPEGAVSYFTLATETDPEASNPWCALGDIAREDKRWEDSLRCYREALARDPEAADIQVQIGYVLLKTGKESESERCFLSALESDPGEYSAYLGLSECYRITQRNADQLRMVKEAMALAPEDPDVWNAQGVALEVAQRLEEATEAYEKALALAPLHRKAANNLGFILEKRMQAGHPDLRERAIEAWKRRLLICRDEGQSLKMAMEHLDKLGIPESTLRHWLAQQQSLDQESC